jgi:uncharacterized membrane protein
MKVTRSRSFVKALSYRIWGTITSFVVVLLITGSAELSGLIAFWETVLKVGVYYLHERGWNFIQWGRRG